MRDAQETEFDDFVRARSMALLRIAFLLTGNRHTAEDLLQEVLEQMCVRWSHIHGTPEAYARRALVNRSTSRWRRLLRRPEAPLENQEIAVPDHSTGVVVRDAVVLALRQLPARQRATVVLRYLDDLSVSDVADALGCSEGTVKSNAARGLERLRELLDAGFTMTAAGEKR